MNHTDAKQMAPLDASTDPLERPDVRIFNTSAAVAPLAARFSFSLASDPESEFPAEVTVSGIYAPDPAASGPEISSSREDPWTVSVQIASLREGSSGMLILTPELALALAADLNAAVQYALRIPPR